MAWSTQCRVGMAFCQLLLPSSQARPESETYVLPVVEVQQCRKARKDRNISEVKGQSPESLICS